MLADRFDALPFGILPVSRTGRVDMLPRDVAARMLLDALSALHMAPPEEPEIVHVCAGESAPRTEAVLKALESLDHAHRRGRARTVRVPVATLLAASEELGRYHRVTPGWQNALIGLRYLSLDRIFERSRLASLVPDPLPRMTMEQLVRSAFELALPDPAPRGGGTFSLARFSG